jgi:hypothetical protein
MANVSEQDYELLSAYVDGMLDEEERLTLEARLRSDADLLHELTALYLTLAMVKQLPTITAPRNFTLKESPARWLVFPTSPVFSALSAAAATILVIIGITLLSTNFMFGTASAPAMDTSQEVALQSNQRTDDAADSSTTNEQALLITPTSNLYEFQQDAQLTDMGLLTTTAQGVALNAVQETATSLALQFSTTLVANYASTGELPPLGAGGGTTPSEAPTMAFTAVPTFAPSTMQDGASTNPVAPSPLSTGTAFPTGTQFAAFASTMSPDEMSGSDADTAMDTRSAVPTATPQSMIAESTEGDAEAELAQVVSGTPVPTMTAMMTSTPTPRPTATATPAAAPPSARSSAQIPAILGIVLVLGGALLFGVAFMTAVTRRGDRRRTK